ncbi:MAG: TetR/AcrR family transcriptional regulator [Alphaproteobacteria bacterium]
MSSNKIDTRERILRSALELLETGNPDSVRMSDIAKRAGVSRQALYLHFPNRADLLIATTRYLDAVKDVDARLAPSRSAKSGIARLDAFVEAWGSYIPEIQGVINALMAMKDTDKEARAAWDDRMQAVRQGCAAAVKALKKDQTLATGLNVSAATDMLWTLLSVQNWEQLTADCGWSQTQYLKQMKRAARKLLVDPGHH